LLFQLILPNALFAIFSIKVMRRTDMRV
jgi:hypothetical protein